MIKIPIGEVAYIHNIGYAVLLECPNQQSIASFDPSLVEKDDPYDALQVLFQTATSYQAKDEHIVLSLHPTNYQIYARESLVRNYIHLNVKVFFDRRERVKILIEVNATVDDLKRRVFEILGRSISNFKKIRLIYPLVELQELADNLLIWECRLADNAKLVLLAQQTFNLTVPKDSQIKSKNQTLQKVGNQSYSTVLGDLGFSQSGKYYWEVRIDKFQNQDDVFVGVAYKNIDLTSAPTHCKFWGIVPLYAKRFSPIDVGNLINYGTPVQAGQSVGVLIQFVNKKANITFFRNGISFGVGFSGVSGVLYPAVTLFGSSNNIVQISYDPKAPLPYIS